MRFNIREEDFFARIGGDEFCIILSNCTREKAERKLKKMQRMFGGEKAHSYGKASASGLWSSPENHAPVSVETVLYQADMFMYQQKREKNGTKTHKMKRAVCRNDFLTYFRSGEGCNFVYDRMK